MVISTNATTDLDTAVAFQDFPDTAGGVTYYWAIAGKFIWRARVDTAGYVTAFAKDGATGTPSGAGTSTSMSSLFSDLVAYGRTYMVASGRTALYGYIAANGQWYNPTSSPNLHDGAPHPMCVYGQRFYVVDNSVQVLSMGLPTGTTFPAPVTSGSNFLNLNNKGYPVTQITCLRPVSNGIWVFTINQAENGCYVFKWDGNTATDPNSAYIIPDASGILAAVIKDDRPWCLDNNGRLMYFNGGTFVPARNGRLPVKNPKQLKNSLSAQNDRWIHPNGMVVVDGRIRILINNENADNGATIEENLASGIWEYDSDIGWYHLTSLSLCTNAVTDYGQNRISQAGALYFAKTSATTSTTNGTMLAGATVLTDASTTAANIYYNDSNDTIQKYGYIVTSKIYSRNLTDIWQLVVPRFKKFLNSSDEIVVKVRFDDPAPTEATITWTSTTTFTTTTDISAYNPTTLGYNPEVEVLQGKGSGKCAHITSVANNAGTYTVTVDEAFTGATSGTAKARFQNWKKIGSYTGQTKKFARLPVNASDTWIQIKVCLLFTGKDELDDLIVINKAQQLSIE